MTALVAVFILGALTRLVDGSNGIICGVKIPNGVRVVVMSSLCAFAWWHVTLNPYMIAWGAGFCALSLIVGQTDWKDWLWQPMRFGLFGFAASWWMMPDTSWDIPLVMAFGGLSYPALFWIGSKTKLPIWWICDGPEAYGRIVAGGLCCSSPLFGPVLRSLI